MISNIVPSSGWICDSVSLLLETVSSHQSADEVVEWLCPWFSRNQMKLIITIERKLPNTGTLKRGYYNFSLG